MVEPPDLDSHLAAGRLPQGLKPADVGPIRPARGQKDGAVTHAQPLPSAASAAATAASPDLTVHAPGLDPLVTFGAPLPQVLVRKERGHTDRLLVILYQTLIFLCH